MSACGVCQHWRSVGTALFFANNSWQGQATIRHPKQLLTLVSLLHRLHHLLLHQNPSPKHILL